MKMSDSFWRFLSRLAIFSKKLATIAALFATGWGAIEWAMHWRQDRQRDLVSQISTYGSFKELIVKSHCIELKVNAWMRDEWPKYDEPAKREELLKKYKTGADIYYSKEMENFREIHSYFEELGIVVNHKVVDFTAFFDAVTFPSNYEEETREFQKFIGDHWFGKHGIAGFTENMQKMSYQYAQGRIAAFAAAAEKAEQGTPERHRLEGEREYWTGYAKKLKVLVLD